MSSQNRYTDAYRYARTVDDAGRLVKILGVIAAVLTMVGAFSLGERVGGAAVIVGLCSAVLVAVPFYVLGVLVSTQGQVLLAVLDTAVNTSNLLPSTPPGPIHGTSEPVA